MPYLNYKKEFVIRVITGRKKLTIRPPGKNPYKPRFKAGDKLFHFTGMMRPGCRALGVSLCTGVKPLFIENAGTIRSNVLVYSGDKSRWGEKMYEAGDQLDVEPALMLAYRDGFNWFREFSEFFINTYKLEPGRKRAFVLIDWEDFQPAALTVNENERRAA